MHFCEEEGCKYFIFSFEEKICDHLGLMYRRVVMLKVSLLTLPHPQAV